MFYEKVVQSSIAGKGMKKTMLMILKTFVVIFFSVFYFNKLSGPRMSLILLKRM